jgi:hypothetical protein
MLNAPHFAEGQPRHRAHHKVGFADVPPFPYLEQFDLLKRFSQRDDIYGINSAFQNISAVSRCPDYTASCSSRCS